jgi:hypothetical protein
MRRSNYAMFDDGTELNPVPTAQLNSRSHVDGSATVTEVGHGDHIEWDSRPKGSDDDSEKAIVQTKTFAIQYDRE